MRKICIFFITFGIAVFSLSAQSYLLSELLELSLAHDDRLVGLQARIDSAQAQKSDSYGSFHPRISGSAKAGYISETPQMELPIPGAGAIEAGQNESYSAALNVQQLLFSGMSRTAAVGLANNALSQESYSKSKRGDELRFMVIQAAYSYLLASLSVDSLDSSLARLELNKRKVLSFRSQGLVSELDVLEIDAGIEELKVKQAAQTGARDQARVYLQTLTGVDNIQDVVFDDSYLNYPKEAADYLETVSVASSPALVSLDYGLNAISIQKKLHMSAFYPKAFVYGSLQYGKPGANMFSDEWQFYYSGGVEVSIDFWDGGSRFSALKQDNARLRELAAQKSELVSSLSSKKEQLLLLLSALDVQYEAAAKLYGIRESKYELIQRLWQAGQKTTIDVLSSEQELTESELLKKQLEIKRLSHYQELLQIINEPIWNEQKKLQEQG